MNAALENWEYLWQLYGKPALFLIRTPDRDTQVAFTDPNGVEHAIPSSCLVRDTNKRLQDLPVVDRPVDELPIDWDFEAQTAVFSVKIHNGDLSLLAQVVARNGLEAVQQVKDWLGGFKVSDDAMFLYEDEKRSEGVFNLIV